MIESEFLDLGSSIDALGLGLDSTRQVPVPLRVFCNPRCNTDSYLVIAVYVSVFASWQAPAGDSRDPHDRGATVELFCEACPPLLACASV